MAITATLLFRFTKSCSDEKPVNNGHQLFSHIIGGNTRFVDPPWARERWLRPACLSELRGEDDD